MMEFIIYTNTIWDSPPRARHQLAHALSQNHKVTFIASNEMGMPGLQTIKVNSRLEVIIPSFPLSKRFRYRTPLLNEGYQAWLFPILKRKFKDRDNLIVICTDFGGYLINKFLSPVIYFASDDYINNVKVPAAVKAYTAYTQRKLIEKSMMALATAQTLVSDFKKYNKRSYELPLGAPEFKMTHPNENILRKRDGKIKVVLLGFIDKIKTPVALLNKILAIDQIHLYLIGPIKGDILELLHHGNKVHSLGIQTGQALSETLQDMDVSIAPYYMEDTNTGRTPNKMWQYLAAGKPAVITNLPNVRHWEFPEGTVYKANTDDEFVEMIVNAYDADSQELIGDRMKLAKENSWGKRAELLVKLIRENHIGNEAGK
ncbi:MAG: glycosyltransferase [Cyclobacteriaceae bacterium]